MYVVLSSNHKHIYAANVSKVKEIRYELRMTLYLHLEIYIVGIYIINIQDIILYIVV